MVRSVLFNYGLCEALGPSHEIHMGLAFGLGVRLVSCRTPKPEAQAPHPTDEETERERDREGPWRMSLPMHSTYVYMYICTYVYMYICICGYVCIGIRRSVNSEHSRLEKTYADYANVSLPPWFSPRPPTALMKEQSFSHIELRIMISWFTPSRIWLLCSLLNTLLTLFHLRMCHGIQIAIRGLSWSTGCLRGCQRVVLPFYGCYTGSFGYILTRLLGSEKGKCRASHGNRQNPRHGPRSASHITLRQCLGKDATDEMKHRGPKEKKSIRISHSGSKDQHRWIAEVIFCRIPVYLCGLLAP